MTDRKPPISPYIAEENRITRIALVVPTALGLIGWAIIGGLYGWMGIAVMGTVAILLFAAAIGGLRAGED